MIIFVYGTTAEAIKIAPVARRLRSRGIAVQHWVTFQHTEALRRILAGLGIERVDHVVADGHRGSPLRGWRDVLPWVWTVLRWTSRHARALRRELPESAIVVVHGDTMTTVMGAHIARRLGRRLAHIEAGLRSGDWRHPFPEELDRRIVGRVADVHYAPSAEAVANLGHRSNVVLTHGNTVVDAVLDVATTPEANGAPYGIALLHRFEYFGNRDVVTGTMRVLAKSPVPVYFFLDVFARGMVADLLGEFESSQIVVRDKLEHVDFVRVLAGAEFVVTDSGGIQEESALLGIPTLVHRKATERSDGLGSSATLSDWDLERVQTFLGDYASYRRPPQKPEHSPSDIVVSDLEQRLNEHRA